MRIASRITNKEVGPSPAPATRTRQFANAVVVRHEVTGISEGSNGAPGLCKMKGHLQHPVPTTYDAAEAQGIAWQAEVELAILLGIEESLRIALHWITRGRGNSHKLTTLRFQTWSFKRHLTCIQVLADHGGYMHLIADASPHLAGGVDALRKEQEELNSDLDPDQA